MKQKQIVASELRIWNWIHVTGGTVPCNHRITPQDMVDIHGNRIDQSITILPIPLTDKWLERASFDRTSDNEHWFINHNGFCFVFDGEDWCLKTRIDEPYVICYVRYVHQLQNLYFALTGKELEFGV